MHITLKRINCNTKFICNCHLKRNNSETMPSVLWYCLLGDRKGIRPVKNWVVGCWHGYLSGARCRLAYGPADATATHCVLLQENRLVLPFWYRLTQVVPEKGPLNGCVCVWYLLYSACDTCQQLHCSTLCLKRLRSYNFNVHQPTIIIFHRNVACNIPPHLSNASALTTSRNMNPGHYVFSLKHYTGSLYLAQRPKS